MSQPADDPGEVGEDSWELRRDLPPDRAPLLNLLANVSLSCGGLSCLFLVPAVVGLPLGLVALVMAKRDLGLMRDGLLDPRGRAGTARAQATAVGAIWFNAFGMMGVWAVVAYVLSGGR